MMGVVWPLTEQAHTACSPSKLYSASTAPWQSPEAMRLELLLSQDRGMGLVALKGWRTRAQKQDSATPVPSSPNRARFRRQKKKCDLGVKSWKPLGEWLLEGSGPFLPDH